MLIFPAIDLRQGRCVRLYQGDPDQETVFSEDPVEVARTWAEEGIPWLHVVNLDGAFGEQGDTPQAVRRLIEAVASQQVQVQLGGGLRTLEAIDQALSWGVGRVILGTVAVEAPDLVGEAVARFGAERVVVGLDARDGQVAVKGWQESSGQQVLDVALAMKERGVERLIYTDIARDGTQQGVNVAATGELAQKSGLKLIASGGVGTLDDLRQVRWIEPYGVEGVIVGRALYERAFTLQEALAIGKGSEDAG